MICTNDPRRAIHDVLCLHARSGERFERAIKGTTGGSSHPGAIAGEILIALHQLPELLGHWIAIGYAPSFNEKAADAIRLATFDAMTAGKTLNGYRRIMRHLDLADLAIATMRTKVLGGRQLYSQAEVARKIGVQPSHFERDGWKAVWESAVQFLGATDSEAVAPVEVVCAKRKAA